MKALHSLAAAALCAAIFPASLPAADQGQLEGAASAIFGGGCFWCIESDFEKLPGVIEAESGYIGGHVDNPSYEQVSGGGTGHVEVAKIYYDPAVVSYSQLLDYYWRHIDPTVKDRQFCDVGSQYRTAIFYSNEKEKAAAVSSRTALEQSGQFKTIDTEISPAGTFYRAEEYHQDYYKKNPLRYKFYRKTCGRDDRVKEVWGA